VWSNYVDLVHPPAQTVSNPSTNQAQCGATTLVELNALPLSQTTNMLYTTVQLPNKPVIYQFYNYCNGIKY